MLSPIEVVWSKIGALSATGVQKYEIKFHDIIKNVWTDASTFEKKEHFYNAEYLQVIKKSTINTVRRLQNIMKHTVVHQNTYWYYFSCKYIHV